MPDLSPEFEFENIGIISDDIISEAEQLARRNIEASENKGLFTIKSANRWIDQAKNRPIPQKLFGEFWFEFELCILFADTNLGKSILAVQIGNSISKGIPIRGFPSEVEKQPILYFDFELSDKQFENRYSENYEQHYHFDDNFYRVEINPYAEVPEKQTFEDYLYYSLEKSIIETGAKILIIDNLTYLKDGTETARDALPLMKYLIALKSKYGISILVLAHTPKIDPFKPITKNHLQGSKMLINFCDSSFAIGESNQDKNFRYIKQIKVRQTEKRYETENVCVCQIEKSGNFLQFEFLGFSSELDHLRQLTENDKKQILTEVMELKKKGVSNIEIARKYSVSEGAIRKWIKKADKTEPV